MLIYRKGKLGENKKIVDTINKGFSDVRDNADFQNSAPKVYKEDGLEHLSLLCFDKDKIVGSLTLLPTHFEVEEDILNVGYIGSVAVIPEARGKGIMSTFMKMSIKEMKEENYDISILSGQRQRYGYFGYYPFGYVYEFLFDKQNIKHTVERVSEFTFVELLDENSKHLNDIYKSYHKRLFKARPKDRFYDYLRSRRLRVFVILKDEKYFGYYLVRDEKTIFEIEINELDELRDVLSQILLANSLEDLRVVIMPFEIDKIKELNKFTENYAVFFKDLAKIINFERTIELLLKLSNKVKKLDEGSLVIEIIDYGTIKLEVNEQITVKKTDKEATIKLTKEEVTSLTTIHSNMILEYKNWFPILVSIPFADSF